MSDGKTDCENEEEAEEKEEGEQTRPEKRLKFYEKRINELIIDRKMPHPEE